MIEQAIADLRYYNGCTLSAYTAVASNDFMQLTRADYTSAECSIASSNRLCSYDKTASLRADDDC